MVCQFMWITVHSTVLVFSLPGRVDVHVESDGARDHFHLHVNKLDIQSAKLYKGHSKVTDGATRKIKAQNSLDTC